MERGPWRQLTEARTDVAPDAVACIVGPDGAPVGAGLVLGAGLVITCTHVVRGVAPDFERRADARIVVKVPFTGNGWSLPCVRWTREGDEPESDLAVLAASDTAVEWTMSCLDLPQIYGRRVRAYGFPGGSRRGVWAEGEMVGRRPNGSIQVVDPVTTGHRIGKGFSGGPVFDVESGEVAGLVTSAEQAPDLKVAYVVPATVVRSFVAGTAEAKSPTPGPLATAVESCLAGGLIDADTRNSLDGLGPGFEELRTALDDYARIVKRPGRSRAAIRSAQRRVEAAYKQALGELQ